jgi:signal transduction histidine kinase
MNTIKKAWGYAPFRWGAMISGLTAATILVLPGLRIGGYSANRFLPHATCYLRDPGLIWLNVISDSFIAAAYLTISGALGYIVYKARHDIPFHWMFGAFGLFIVTCGFTHVMSVVTVWKPYYWLAGDIKAITAVASVATAVVLPITVPRVFSLIHDAKISDQRKLDLEAAHARLKESDELKSQFFANVSHELRTPLTLILGPIRRRLAAGDLSDEERGDLEVAARNAGLLLQQVNNLLDLAKIEARSMRPRHARVDLARVARLVSSYFDSLASERAIAYELVLPEAVPAEADPDKVQRVFLNLLSNAFKFTPEGGRIRCTLDAGGRFVVEDSGPGIPKHLHEAVFDRFRQIEGGSSRRVGGTGLGLAIVKEFVSMHGGSVHVGRGEMGGARVEVRLPLQAPPGAVVAEAPDPAEWENGQAAVDEVRSYVPRSEASEPSPPAESDGRPLVLVVEDNPDMNAFVADTLRSRYHVATASDGQEGLAAARRLGPDLIVSDIMMPLLSGDEMIRALREDPELRETPIVVLTAKADDEQRVRLLEESVQDHLTKPFLPEELLARVGGLIQRRRETIAQLRAMNENLEQRVAERTAEVQTLNERLRLLAADLSTTEQRERRRLAQVLHEHLQQLLIAVKFGLEEIAARSDAEPVGRMRDALDEAIKASRGITADLYPPVLYDLGLAAALEWLSRRTRQQYGLAVEVRVDADADPTDQDLQAFLFSAVQELLLNTVKHAQTDRAEVVMQREGDALVITVEDEGIGCTADAVEHRQQSGMGFGLFNIRERLRVMGGHLTVAPLPERGCRVRLSCPLQGPIAGGE